MQATANPTSGATHKIQPDLPEGSRETIGNQLARQGGAGGAADGVAKYPMPYCVSRSAENLLPIFSKMVRSSDTSLVG